MKRHAREWKGAPDEDEDLPSSSAPNGGSNKRPRSDTTGTTHERTQTNPLKQVAFEEQLLRAFVSAGWSFNSITDPEVQKLFHGFIPGAVIPTRQKLSDQILSRELVKMEGSLKQSVQGAYATLQQDGWKDLSKKHLVAFMYTANREVIHTVDILFCC